VVDGVRSAVPRELVAPKQRRLVDVEWTAAHVDEARHWSGLGTELLAGPLSIWRRSRPIAWVALALLHLVVIATMRTTMLSLGALLPLAFAFDAHWIRPVRPRGQEARQLKNRSERTHGAARQGRSALADRAHHDHCGLERFDHGFQPRYYSKSHVVSHGA
jgi:hypothetical protein